MFQNDASKIFSLDHFEDGFGYNVVERTAFHAQRAVDLETFNQLVDQHIIEIATSAQWNIWISYKLPFTVENAFWTSSAFLFTSAICPMFSWASR